MIKCLPGFNFCILLLLSLLHVYWALGGRWAYDNVLPTDVNGRKLFKPGVGITLFVAIGLSAFAWMNLICLCGLGYGANRNYVRFGMFAIGIVFLIRTIGDFKYIGFMKRYRNSRFALRDTWFYSPLCLLLSISHLISGLS